MAAHRCLRFGYRLTQAGLALASYHSITLPFHCDPIKAKLHAKLNVLFFTYVSPSSNMATRPMRSRTLTLKTVRWMRVGSRSSTLVAKCVEVEGTVTLGHTEPYHAPLMNTHSHACTHARTQPHACTHACMHACMACTCAHTGALTHACTQHAPRNMRDAGCSKRRYFECACRVEDRDDGVLAIVRYCAEVGLPTVTNYPTQQ